MKTLTDIVNAPIDLRDRISPSSLRGMARALLRKLLIELERRRTLSPDGFPVISPSEERAARFAMATYSAAVDETAVERALPPLDLGSLTEDDLKKLAAS